MTLPKAELNSAKKNNFILASASPRRLDLLRQIACEPEEIFPAEIDETPIKGELPHHYAARVALQKAECVASQKPGIPILSADTCVALGRRILGKAENENDARKFLNMLSGRRHRVYTGVTLISADGGKHSKLCLSTVKFKLLTRQEIDLYIASGEWEGKAGGYAIQGLAAGFISFISGSYSNIVGLPLYETRNLLTGAGITK